MIKTCEICGSHHKRRSPYTCSPKCSKERVIQKKGKSLYYMWHNMKARCKYKCTRSYERYGGRGISVCSEWYDSFDKFKSFAVGAGRREGLQIDRIDNDRGYEPNNVRFVSAKVNSLNRGVRSDSISGFTGVKYRKNNSPKSRYTVTICVGGKEVNLGSYPTIKEGVQVRNEYIINNNLKHRIQEYD